MTGSFTSGKLVVVTGKRKECLAARCRMKNDKEETETSFHCHVQVHSKFNVEKEAFSPLSVRYPGNDLRIRMLSDDGPKDDKL